MDPHEIEDTSGWLGSPTPLETCRHQLRMYENEFEALTLQLQRALENVKNLVEMNDRLSAELQKNRTWMANLEAETTEQLSELSSLRMVQSQNDTLRRQLQAALNKHTPEVLTPLAVIRLLAGQSTGVGLVSSPFAGQRS